MTTKSRRQKHRRRGADRSFTDGAMRPKFADGAICPKTVPPVTSWWVRVERAAWRAAVAEHERRWRRTETSTPTPGV